MPISARSFFQHAGLQPFADQADDTTVADALLDKPDQPLMADRVDLGRLCLGRRWLSTGLARGSRGVDASLARAI
jgi:hypothetical protein